MLAVCSPAAKRLARKPLGNKQFGESWLSLLKVEQNLLGWMARRRACKGEGRESCLQHFLAISWVPRALGLKVRACAVLHATKIPVSSLPVATTRYCIGKFLHLG